MIKFKILRWVLLLLIATNLVNVGYTISMLYDSAYSPAIPRFSREITIFLYIMILRTLVTTTGLYFLQRSCAKFIREGYFNTKSRRSMTIGGWIITGEAAITLIRIAFSYKPLQLEEAQRTFSFYNGISFSILMLIMGFSIVAAADILKKGERIKNENDLTI